MKARRQDDGTGDAAGSDKGAPRRTPNRAIRIDGELWDAAQQACNWRGDLSVSHVIRRSLANYVAAANRSRVSRGLAPLVGRKAPPPGDPESWRDDK